METTFVLHESTIKDSPMLWNTLTESIQNTLPKDFKKFYQSSKNRKEILIKFGKKSFLMPEKLKFPIVNPETGKYDCRLIYAAYLRSLQWSKKKPEYVEINKKAKSLYDEFNCSNKIKVHIQDTQIDMDIEQFMNIFDTVIENV